MFLCTERIGLEIDYVLIVGSKGQDARLLIEILAKKNLRQITIDRKNLCIDGKIAYKTEDLNYFVFRKIFARYQITTVYFTAASALPRNLRNLAHENSLKDDFEKIEKLLLVLLETICTLKHIVRFVYFSSCLRWGKLEGELIENTPVNPSEPYGEHKVRSEHIISNFDSKNTNLTTLNLILFNHASHFSDKGFLMPKICVAVKNKDEKWLKKEASKERLHSDGIDIGYAKQFMKFSSELADRGLSGQYIIATGKTFTIHYFFERALELVGHKTNFNMQNSLNRFFHANNKKMIHALNIEEDKIISGIELINALLTDMNYK